MRITHSLVIIGVEIGKPCSYPSPQGGDKHSPHHTGSEYSAQPVHLYAQPAKGYYFGRSGFSACASMEYV